MRATPPWSRSRIIATTRRRRCCCSSCAARVRAALQLCRKMRGDARGGPLVAAASRRFARGHRCVRHGARTRVGRRREQRVRASRAQRHPAHGDACAGGRVGRIPRRRLRAQPRTRRNPRGLPTTWRRSIHAKRSTVSTLSQVALYRMAGHRARNLLRWFLHARGLPAPSSARLAAMLDQLRASRGDAMTRFAHAGMEVGVYRGRIYVHACPPAPYDVPWDGACDVDLPHGVLRIAHAEGQGIDALRIRRRGVSRSFARRRRALPGRGEPPAARAQVHPAGCRHSALATRGAAAGRVRRRSRRRAGNRCRRLVASAGGRPRHRADVDAASALVGLA